MDLIPSLVSIPGAVGVVVPPGVGGIVVPVGWGVLASPVVGGMLGWWIRLPSGRGLALSSAVSACPGSVSVWVVLGLVSGVGVASVVVASMVVFAFALALC